MQKMKKAVLIIGVVAALLFVSFPAYAAAYRYDKLGRLVETTYDSGKTVTYTYDSKGNMTAVTGLSAEAKLTGLEFDPSVDFVKVEETLNLTLKANYSDGTAIVVTAGAEFSSSDELIATVDNAGKVTAISEGEVTVTANYKDFSATAKVTVVSDIGVSPVITTPSGELISGTVGESYYAVIEADNEPLAFEITEGSLPDGLILGDDGIISGTPATAGIYGFSVTASNAAGTSDAVEFSIAIADAPVVPSIPVFTDANGNILDSLSSDTLNVAMPYTNTTDKQVNLAMIVTVYAPNGQLVHTGADTREVGASQTETFNVSLYMPQNADGSYALNGYYANVFLWDSNTFVPITDKYTF